ncbi:MAG: hypothetical protein Q7T71_17720 [Herbiconiux sp.]|nr:hypothetical protein [Herbiconiux sp.]
MSLDQVDKQMDAVRERAARVQSNASARKNQINQDPNLTPQGRDAALEKVNTESRAIMDQLRAEEIKLATDKRDSLRRTVMGTVGTDSSSIISYRDAQDRADKLEDRDEAERVMQRALTSGDKALASAVAEAALSKDYRSVYEIYAAANPATAEAAKDLATLERYFTEGSLHRAVAYMVM